MVAYYREADLETMLADFGQLVTVGGVQVRGIVDTPDELALLTDNAAVIGAGMYITFRTSEVPGLAVGAEIRLDGKAHIVRERLRQGDGALTMVRCEEAC